MSTPQDKILKMVTEGQISPTEADKLIGAMNRRPASIR